MNTDRIGSEILNFLEKQKRNSKQSRMKKYSLVFFIAIVDGKMIRWMTRVKNQMRPNYYLERKRKSFQQYAADLNGGNAPEIEASIQLFVI